MKKVLKKLFLLFCVLTFIFSCVGCNGEISAPNSETQNSSFNESDNNSLLGETASTPENEGIPFEKLKIIGYPNKDKGDLYAFLDSKEKFDRFFSEMDFRWRVEPKWERYTEEFFSEKTVLYYMTLECRSNFSLHTTRLALIYIDNNELVLQFDVYGAPLKTAFDDHYYYAPYYVMIEIENKYIEGIKSFKYFANYAGPDLKYFYDNYYEIIE